MTISMSIGLFLRTLKNKPKENQLKCTFIIYILTEIIRKLNNTYNPFAPCISPSNAC